VGEALLEADLRSLAEILAEGAHDNTAQGLPTRVLAAAQKISVNFGRTNDRRANDVVKVVLRSDG